MDQSLLLAKHPPTLPVAHVSLPILTTSRSLSVMLKRRACMQTVQTEDQLLMYHFYLLISLILIFLFQLINEKSLILSPSASADRGRVVFCSVLCHVYLLACTVSKKIAFIIFFVNLLRFLEKFRVMRTSRVHKTAS